MQDREQILKLLQPLLEPIQEGVMITDLGGVLLCHNHGLADLFGLDAEDCRSLSMSDLGGHNMRRILIQAGLDREEETGAHHCEMSLQFDHAFEINSDVRWMRIHTQLLILPCENGRIRMIVFRDITAEKRLFAAMSSKDACGIATEDPDMMRLIDRLNVVAGTDASVLLQGESGTGKTELARLVHQRSRRANKAFVEVNCGAIPASLIESELFGHVKGAFTGAVRDRAGRFKAADGGTLFLDEISELPKELQPKLLRVLQDGEYEAVGSDKTIKVDVRLVSASNQDLREMVDDGAFRPDLYYRIAVVALQVPALRDRPGDIPMLVDVLHKRLVVRGYPADVRFAPEAIRTIMNYPWPGNVRELANTVEHAIICAADGVVGNDSLPDTLQEYCHARRTQSEAPALLRDERDEIEQALRKANGNKTLAAQILGVDRSTLWRRMQRLGMS
ncbi:MAG: sigma 54-interacting transcriptional regulator [Chromatiales bacterium]|nr:sigma 54-interacting transcriptional regulator [Gammaproteobacteria bacterium]MCP5352119.1 sigma 54-interacting transcriptional regulator [Chromatiales bacterium]